LRTDNAGTQEQRFGRSAIAAGTPHEYALDVTDAEPRQSAAAEINDGKTENNAARRTEGFVALLNYRGEGVVGIGFEHTGGDARSESGAFAVADAVDGGDKPAVGVQ